MSCEGLGKRLRDIEDQLGVSGSFERCGTLTKKDLTTASIIFETLETINVADNTVVRVDFEVDARQADGAGRASFKRTGLFYRQGGSVQAQQFWHTIHTIRSNINYDVQYVLTATSVQFKVKAADAQSTLWKGCLHSYVVGI